MKVLLLIVCLFSVCSVFVYADIDIEMTSEDEQDSPRYVFKDEECKTSCTISSTELYVMIKFGFIKYGGTQSWCGHYAEEWLVPQINGFDLQRETIRELLTMFYNLESNHDGRDHYNPDSKHTLCASSMLKFETFIIAQESVFTCDPDHPGYAEVWQFMKAFNDGTMGDSPCISDMPRDHVPYVRSEFWTQDMIELYDIITDAQNMRATRNAQEHQEPQESELVWQFLGERDSEAPQLQDLGCEE